VSRLRCTRTFPQRDLLIRIRHRLQIVVAGHQRVPILLRRPVPQQMQNDLRVLRIVLLPGVVERLACPGDRDRRHQAKMESGLPEPGRERSVVVASRLERDLARLRQRSSVDTKRSISVRVLATHITRRFPLGSSRSTWWVSFATSMATRTAGNVVEGIEVMAGSSGLSCGKPILETHLFGLDLVFRRYYRPEFVSAAMDRLAYTHGVIRDFSGRGKPTDNAAIESFNGRFPEECLNVHWSASIDDAQQKTDAFR
jgi:transposase InsO family protein